MIRQVSYRVDAYRNGVKYKTLRAIESPNIIANSEAAIKSSLSCSFVNDADIDWLSDDIRPFLIIDGVENPLGVFRSASVSTQRTANGIIDNVDAYDRCYLVQANRTNSILHLAAGANYIETIKGFLIDCGIELMLATPSTNTLQTDREDWDLGTDYLTIVNALLAEINYKDLWFDCNGYARIEPKSVADASNINHIYSSQSDYSIVSRNYSRETDIFDTPNVFIVVCSNPDLDEALVSTAENNNANSPLSIVRRGMRVSRVYKVDNIASQAELDDYAQNLCYQSMMGAEAVTISTALEPGHGIGDIIAIKHGDIEGIFEETSWSMSLQPGAQMKHKLKRVIYYG